MEQFNDLAAQQDELGITLQKAISNIKKTPKERKTPDYLERKLEELDELWTKFQQADDTLRKHPEVAKEHPYFLQNLHGVIKEKYHQAREDIQQDIKAIIATLASKKSATGPGGALSKQSISSEPKGQEPAGRRQDVLTKMIRKQSVLINVINNMIEKVLNEKTNQSFKYYQNKAKIIENHWFIVQKLHHQILDEVEDFESSKYDLEEYLAKEDSINEQLLQIQTMGDSSAETSSSGCEPSINNLPKVTLPQFDGNCLKWNQFYDIFRELIDSKPLPKIQKMWYLKSNLTGEAEKLVRHFSLTENNYEAVWTTLQDRYNNRRLITSTALEKLLGQPKQTADQSSVIALKALHDTTKETRAVLGNLGIDTSSWDPILVHMLIKKVDRSTHMAFEQSLECPRELPSLQSFLQFLEKRFQALETIGAKDKSSSSKAVSSVAAANQQPNKCKACNDPFHALFACPKFLRMSINQRFQLLKSNNLCINCLKSGHTSKECTSGKCTKCNQSHNTLVHFEKRLTTSSKPNQSSSSNESGAHSQPTVSMAASHTYTHTGYTLLGTALVRLEAGNGRSIECRALLDSGSQVNLITEKIAKKLELSLKPTAMIIEGVGNNTKRARRRANIQLSSRIRQYSVRLEAVVIPQIISPQPTQHLDISSWNIPKNIDLADPHFNTTSPVEVLLGAELYYDFLTGQKTVLHKGLPTLHSTVFGWILAGKVDSQNMSSPTCAVYTEEDLNQLLEKFWGLEETLPTENTFTASERRCESHFALHTTRSTDGKFMVKLPFTQEASSLGDSRKITMNRFYALERRLAKDAPLKQQYSEFLREYEALGHMSRVSISDISSPCYFIPHHCIQRPESSTTKLRVVFDASSKTSSGLALNDILHTGPTIQNELFSILLRFRLKRYVLTADIEKMYRQIWIEPEDRKYQLIFWRENQFEDLRCYQLNTVTYGTRTAPYLAIKCLQELGQRHRTDYPLGANALLHDFYVDDCLTGADTRSTALEIQRQLSVLLQTAGFKLRKWCSNHSDLLQGIPSVDQEVNLNFNSNEEETIKTLGLIWLPKSDDLCIRVNLQVLISVTKRTILSDIARIFDPLGILSPVVVTAKILIQELWKLKINWDDELPTHLSKQWRRFREQLSGLNNVKLGRHVLPQGVKGNLQIHAFADASEKAYGAVVYLRATDKDGLIVVRLLCAKSRVAPTKTQTLPRLELCAAVLSVQLADRVKRDIAIRDIPIFLWTDSEIVLSWINSLSSSFKTFVANRVATIHRLSQATQWRHVTSKENPADLLSRGMAPDKFRSCPLWFYGPFFLHGRDTTWHNDHQVNSHQRIDDPERKERTVTVVATSTNDLEEIVYKINHHNSFQTLVHVLAYVHKFINKLRSKNSTDAGTPTLSPGEQKEALNTILKAIQQSDFSEELAALGAQKPLSKKSQLLNLNPFLDSDGMIRVGGRLEHAPITYDAKHPVVLPYNDPLVKMLMTWFHEEHCHCGAQALLAQVRQRFWPIKGKSMARSIVQKCVRCTRVRPKLFQQIMGNLPATRTQPARPFVNSGVDFFGPFWIHYKLRGKRPQKAYVAVFCCFATKAVHLEIVSDLSSDAFIGCLKRFIGRRGHCTNLYCDNATNFVGAKNLLADLHEAVYSEHVTTALTRFCSNRGISFKFIPPRAPHFGGLWEAAVKSAKNLFIRSTANASLTYEELETIMVEIESILNSRPLTPLSNDPNDLGILTPGHFLIGEPLTAQIDTTAAPIKTSLLHRWKLVSHLKHEFWRRWVKEYLNELQTRTKWKTMQDNAQQGMMVIVKEDNVAPLQWPLGRIIKVYPGTDKAVRVADVKTAKGTLRRPIHRLAPLPLEQLPEEPHPTSNLPIQQEHDDSSSTSHPKKRKLQSTHVSLLSIIIALLTLPLVLSSQVNILQFNQTTGIHFEQIGSAYISENQWTLIIHYKLSPLKTDLQVLSTGLGTIQHLCEQVPNRPLCEHLVTQLQQSEQELRADNSLLTNRRQKRGAINVIGNVANTLFGVLDDKYAEQMSNTITDIEANEHHLLKLIQNQTSILDATINIMKRDQEASMKAFSRFQQRLEVFTSTFLRIEKDIEDAQKLQLITTLGLELTLVASQLHRIQSSLIDVLTIAHHGHISPLLLSPQQLDREIKRIQSHLSSNIQIAGNQGSLLSVYKLMTVQAGLTEDHVIFKTTIPLLRTDSFTLFRLIPIPVYHNNEMISVKLSTSILAITRHRDKYFPTTPELLQHCDVIQERTYVCPNTQPIFQKGALSNACEVSLFHNESQRLCEFSTADSEIWTKATTENRWYYALATPTRITIICGTEVSQTTLEGSGSIEISANCVIKSDTATLLGSQTFTTSSSNTYTSFGGIADLAKPNQSMPHDHIEQPYTPQLKQLTALQDLLNMQEIADLPRRLQVNNYHNSAIAYLALLAAVTLAIVLFIRYKRRSQKPIPQPRTIQTEEPSDDNFVTIFP